MDNPRHRQILRALRPHGADHSDPDAQAALAAARTDTTLGAWFEREQAFDRVFAEKINTAAAPADLSASIFAAVERAAPAAKPARPARRIIVQRPFATLFAALAAAASITLLAVLLWPRPSRPAALEDMISAAVATTPAAIQARELAGQPLAEVLAWFTSRGAPVPGEIPAAIAQLPTDGAGLVVLNGITSSVVTFEARGFSRDIASGSGDRRLALFTIPRQSCSSAGITRQPTVREHAGHTLAVWRDATSVYVLAVDAPAEDLRQFLSGSGGRVVMFTPCGPDSPA